MTTAHRVIQRFVLAQEDRSTNPTIVEYAVQTMLKKRKDPAFAAKDTAQKHSGTENMFFGPGITHIDAGKLEDAIWDRMVDIVVKNIPKMREGVEHFALDGTMQQFNQKKIKVRAELKKRVVRRLGRDPFKNDDK